MGIVQDVLQRYKGVEKVHSAWRSHWQDLADVMAPNVKPFTRAKVPGERRNGSIYDGTPMLAVRGLVNAIDGMLKPKTSRWMSIRAVQDELNDVDAAKEWMDEATDIMFHEFYRPKARFIQASGETDKSLVVLGSGTLYTTEDRHKNGLMFRSLPLSSTAFQENSDGEIDTLYWHCRWPARIAEEIWGRDKVGPDVLQALKDDKPDQEFEFLQVIRPRDNRDPRMLDTANMPWEYIAIEIKAEHLIEESGFIEWPFATPRWDTESGETYGRSPGMMALPDSRTLQQQGKTILEAGHMAVRPPMMAPHESIVRGPALVPGGMTYYNAAALKTAGIRDPIRPLFTGAQIPLGREMQQDTREQIFAAFFKNVFNLPMDGPQMTATEIIARKEEFAREIGPVFGRLEADYMAPMVERAFGILNRQGKFPPPPEELDGKEIRFEFASPIEKVRRQIDTMNAARTIEVITPFIQADPAVMDNFNGDEIARDTADFNAMPQKWLRPEDEVQALRQQRAQAQQQQAQAAAVERGASATKTLADAAKAGAGQ